LESTTVDGLLSEEEFSRRLNELKGKSFPVLSKGSVTLVDVMGDDRRVVSAARTTSDLKGKGDTEVHRLVGRKGAGNGAPATPR
jgi:thymidylate synthase ThyX